MIDSETDNTILYDVNTYSYPYWMTEIDKDDNIYVEYEKSHKNSNFLCRIVSWMKGKLKFGINENTLKFIFSSSNPWNAWKIVVSEYGSFGLLRENAIEFYEGLDEKFVWRIKVECNYTRISNLFYNKQFENLVLTNEIGNIYFFNLNNGNEVLKYIESELNDFDDAICKLFFIDLSVMNCQNLQDDVLQLMMALTYSGIFKVFAIRKNRSIDLIYRKSLINIVPYGIYCAEVDSKLEYLILGSFTSSHKNSSSNGLHIFRILNSEPWIKNIKIMEEIDSFSKKLNTKNHPKSNFTKIEYVTKMEISSDNQNLVVIYISGRIKIFSLPTLRPLKEWFMTEQPGYNEMNPAVVESPYMLKKFKQIYHEPDYRVIDISWWNSKVLIMTRGTGSLSLVSVESLNNLMGRDQQWLYPYPSIYRYLENEFFILECHCVLSNQAPNFNSENSICDDEHSDSNLNETSELNTNTEDEDDDDEEEYNSWLSYLASGVKSKAFNLIGINGFDQSKKKKKILKRKFSILHIKSTTPEELFERKLKFEEYGEALKLAQTYNLDTDLVYKQQWNSKPISKSTINDYLSKIKKRSWILHECEERISPNIDTTKLLLDFGLHGTDLDSIIAISETDDNRFVYSQKEELDDEDNDDEPFDRFNPVLVEKRNKKIHEIRLRKLSQLNPNNLTTMQKDLCLIRHKLLTYMDRLNVYEQILGGSIKAAELFDPDKYRSIRSKSIYEIALDYAREGNTDAVEILFCFYSKELKNHQLDILSNFPETIVPDEYAKLLPRIENEKCLLFDDEDQIRDNKDWIELPEFQYIIGNDEDDQFKDLTVDQIEKWYYNRALEIESLSGLVDIALSFVHLAYANGCKNMNDLMENLKTLYTLVYECKSDFSDSSSKLTCLSSIIKLTDIEKLEMIMKNSSEPSSDEYSKHLQNWLLPFVLRRPTLQSCESLLREYLLRVSIDDLSPCLKLLHFRSNPSGLNQHSISSFNLNELNLVSIIIDCMYVNEKQEQINICHQLINDMTVKPDGQVGQKEKIPLTHHQQQQLKHVKEHLHACELFKKYGINKTLSFIKKSCSDSDSCRDALIKLTSFSAKRPEYQKLIVHDLSHLQEHLYKDLIDNKQCTEILVTSLLRSKNLENFKLAVDLLEDIYHVDKEAAVQLGIKSAQDYFNSSSNYADTDIFYSKVCIDLVLSIIAGLKTLNFEFVRLEDLREKLKNLEQTTSDPILESCFKMINDEIDLLFSMKLIAEFDFGILPVQVRVTGNRFKIITDILDQNEYAYKNFEQLLKLASSLHVKTIFKDDNKPEVMLLIAQYALKNSNFSILKQMCYQMVSLNFEPAWYCVFKLALYLANNICSAHAIQIIVLNNAIVEKLYDNLNEQFVFSSIGNHLFDFSSTFGWSKEKTLKSLQEIEQFLSFVVTNCDIEYIEGVLYQKLNIQSAKNRIETQEETVVKSDKFNFEKISSNLFNNDKNLELNLKETKKKCLNAINCVKKLNYFKSNLNLDETVTYFMTSVINSLTEIEAKCTFAYLLCLDEIELNYLFEKNKSLEFCSDKSYQFIVHLLVLNLAGELFEDDFEAKQLLYELNQSLLVNFVESKDKSEFKNEKTYILFQKINRKFTEYDHHNQMEHLNAGIDLERFDTDQIYKEETILGLSMDYKQFKLACSLAKFYSVDLWKVYMAFTEYMLCDVTDLELGQIETDLKPLTGLLIQRTQEYKENMNKRVYEFLDGKNLDKLILYYSLLNDSESDLHVKNLKKLKSVQISPNFDYKEMLKRPFEVIEPFLDDSNLQLFSKIIQKTTSLNPSKLNVVWCLKKFWTLVDSLLEKSSDNSWNHIQNVNLVYDNLDNMGESIKKLELRTDFIYFVGELCLSEKSFQKLNFSIRKELLKKMNKIIKVQKNEQNFDLEQINKEFIKIQNIFKLIDNIEKKLDSKDNVLNSKYLNLFDVELAKIYFLKNETNEQVQKLNILENILINMFFDGFSIETLYGMIKLFDFTDKTSVKNIIQLSLNRLCSELKNDSQNMIKLNLLLETISSYLSANDATKSKSKKDSKTSEAKIITDQDFMDCMRSFCNDQQIDIKIRLFILEELNKIVKNMKEEDLMLLLVFQTNAILANCDFFGKKTNQIESDLIESEEKRKNLILDYIELSKTKQDFKSLLNFIKIWPSFSDEDSSNKPLNLILLKMILNNIDLNILTELNDDQNLELSEKDFIFLRKSVFSVKDNSSLDDLKISFLKACLLLKNTKILESIKKYVNCMDLEFMKNLEFEGIFVNGFESNPSFELVVNDHDLMTLFLKDNFYLEFVNTNFYEVFYCYLIRNKTTEDLHEIVNVLKKNGHSMEAAKLLCEAENFCGSYRTLSVSLAFLEKFNN